MSNTPHHKSDGAHTQINNDGLFQQTDAKDLMKEWAHEATQFVQRNPWVAVAAAAAIGYWLGSKNGRRFPAQDENR